MPMHTVVVYELRTADVEVEAATLEDAERLVAQDVLTNHHDGLLSDVTDWHLEDDGVTTNPSNRRSYTQA